MEVHTFSVFHSTPTLAALFRDDPNEAAGVIGATGAGGGASSPPPPRPPPRFPRPPPRFPRPPPPRFPAGASASTTAAGFGGEVQAFANSSRSASVDHAKTSMRTD